MILTALLSSACGAQKPAFNTQPLNATATPFQPLPLTPTSTPTQTITPFPPTSTPSNTQVPATPTLTTQAPVNEPETQTTNGEPDMVTVPILLYHHISDTIDTQYNVYPDRFAEQMNWLYERGYETITIADLARAVRDGSELPERPVVLTFDDGYPDVYQNAYPILQRYGYVATFYIIANTLDTAGNLSTNELQELLMGGWEIGCHSMTHADLTGESDWENEIYNSKLVLEEKLETEILTFAYPYGKADDEIKDFTADAGYTAAVGLGSIMEHNLDTLYFLHRKEIKSWYGLDFFVEFLPWID